VRGLAKLEALLEWMDADQKASSDWVPSGSGYTHEILLTTPTTAEVFRDRDQKLAWAAQSTASMAGEFNPNQYGTDTTLQAVEAFKKILVAANNVPAGKPAELQVFANVTTPAHFQGATRGGSYVDATGYICEFEVTLESYDGESGARDVELAGNRMKDRLRRLKPFVQTDSKGYDHRTEVDVSGNQYTVTPMDADRSMKGFVRGTMKYTTNHPHWHVQGIKDFF